MRGRNARSRFPNTFATRVSLARLPALSFSLRKRLPETQPKLDTLSSVNLPGYNPPVPPEPRGLSVPLSHRAETLLSQDQAAQRVPSGTKSEAQEKSRSLSTSAPVRAPERVVRTLGGCQLGTFRGWLQALFQFTRKNFGLLAGLHFPGTTFSGDAAKQRSDLFTTGFALKIYCSM